MSSSSHVSLQDLRQALISLRNVGQLETFLQETFQNDAETSGAMTDGSKRRADVLESDEDFDLISSVSVKQPPAMPVSSAAVVHEKPMKGYPKDCVSGAVGPYDLRVAEGGQSSISYGKMLEESKTKKEMGEYLSWVYNTRVQNKKADDLRAYLKAMRWDSKNHWIEKDETQMMYPGWTMVRHLD